MRLRVLSTAAALLAVMPGVSLGLGLGDIQLKSTLNAPLDAEIELFATDEELGSLQTQLAAREVFTRYGLDYPAFLTGVQVALVRKADGTNAIRLTSSAAMIEPFATILIEAAWARGRIQREYTLLFDPPAFAPATTPPVPVAAPTTGSGQRSGTIAPRPAPAPTPAPAATPTAPASAGGQYAVRSGDSLSAIAQRQYGTANAEQAMIAIYRGNPEAFDGNINLLRAGTLLRLPDDAAIAAVSPAEAAGEVRRQSAAWSGRATSAASTADAGARLRLVPPGEAGAAGGGSGAATAESRDLRDRVTQLESELADTRRLLELRNAELARLQAGAASAPQTAEPAPAEAPAPTSQPEEAAPAAAEPSAAPEAVAEATPEPKPGTAEKPEPVAKAPAATEEPSLLERLRAFWYVPAGLLALLAAALALLAVRKRRAEAAFAPFGVATTANLDEDAFGTSSVNPRDNSIVVEETSSDTSASARREARMTVDLDDGATSATVPALDATGAFEQGDPLAEADFHMAYGLYDQAADLVKLAIQKEPGRRDLKLKLLEVFFVWGNKDQFLQTARELAETRDAAQPGEWEKVVIMGKQLAPEDPLFSQSQSSAGPAPVDLNLEGGQNLVDFDLAGEPSLVLPVDNIDAGAPGDELGGLDFVLDDPARGADDVETANMRRMAEQAAASEEGPTARMAVEGPTVEQPALGIEDTLAGKLGAHAAQLGSPDQTAELSLDDLGLDLGKLDATGGSLLDDSQLVAALGSGDSDSNQPTELLPLAPAPDPDADTSSVQALDLSVDFSDQTGKTPIPDFNLDLDVGTATSAGESQLTQRIDLPLLDEGDTQTQKELEPVTMSEVGTKLDLARAYMDMGDPDGARSILGEVLQEGSSAQRQEAQRLLDSIPG
jgi:pilus assembly protein FimV